QRSDRLQLECDRPRIGRRDIPSARLIAAASLWHSYASPGAVPSSVQMNGRAEASQSHHIQPPGVMTACSDMVEIDSHECYLSVACHYHVPSIGGGAHRAI